MLLRLFLLILCWTAVPLLSNDLYWVFLNDIPSTERVSLTKQAQDRMALKGHPDKSQSNNPVPEQILHRIRSMGVHIRHSSRFLNAVSVRITHSDQISQLENLADVAFLRPLAVDARSEPIVDIEDNLYRQTSFDYGQSASQNEKLEIPGIHDLGYTGSGILIAVLDAGFYTVHPTFDQLDIVAQYDFVDHEPNPSGVGHEHGINVLSALAGYSPGTLMGPAYGASVLLARTENDISETKAEEDNWIAALEWADSLGADIVSSSLNYREFDNPEDNYPYSALDGQTAVITQAVNIAAQKGILVVNSVGNEGAAPGSLWPPADSPNMLAVGAVSAIDSILYFSGRGPSYDGRFKPDVVALGTNVYVASGTDGFKRVSGTSFSAPLIAGLAALLLESNPALTPGEIIDLFQTQGDRSDNPDNAYGYGIPKLLSHFSPQDKLDEIMIYPNPHDGFTLHIFFHRQPRDPIRTAQVFDIQGRLLGRPRITVISERDLLIDISSLSPLASQIYFLTVSSDTDFYSAKFIHLH